MRDYIKFIKWLKKNIAGHRIEEKKKGIRTQYKFFTNEDKIEFWYDSDNLYGQVGYHCTYIRNGFFAFITFNIVKFSYYKYMKKVKNHIQRDNKKQLNQFLREI